MKEIVQGKVSKCLFLGASSYVGLRLIKKLAVQGHEITCIVRNEDSINKINQYAPGLNYLSPNESIPKQDFVFNLVCDYGLNDKDKFSLRAINVEYPLEIVKKIHFQKLINFSTALERNLSSYAESKVILEEELLKRFRNVCNLKIHALYGPASPEHYFINFLFKNLSFHEPQLAMTDCVQSRDFIHVDDLISAVMLLMERDDLPKEIEIGSGVSYNLKEVANFIHKITGSMTQINFGALQRRAHEPLDLKANITYMQSQGWETKFELFDYLVGASKKRSCRIS